MILSNETRKLHTLSNCSACRLYNSHYQATYPLSNINKSGKKGPFSDISSNANKHTQLSEGFKATKRQLKTVGQAIYSAYNDKYKENYGKTMSEILVLVPEAGLNMKRSPLEKKGEKRNQLRHVKKTLEKNIQEIDINLHFSLNESYSSRQQRRLT